MKNLLNYSYRNAESKKSISNLPELVILTNLINVNILPEHSNTTA